MVETSGKIEGWTWAGRLRAAFRPVVDFVYPPVCCGCSTRTLRHGALCPACWREMHFIERPYCAVLGIPFSYDPGEGMVSAEAIASPPSFDRLRAVALHEGAARALVHGLKYRDRTDLAPMMAAWMLRAADGHLATCDGIIPIPLHWTRLSLRRFNQAAELARHLARLSDRPLLVEPLKRARRTRRQVGLTARAREDNVRSAFRVVKGLEDQVFGKRLVLVDDVYTTGATVSAAARVLKRAGASEVTVLTFAMALREPI
jgi:ComF family protein